MNLLGVHTNHCIFRYMRCTIMVDCTSYFLRYLLHTPTSAVILYKYIRPCPIRGPCRGSSTAFLKNSARTSRGHFFYRSVCNLMGLIVSKTLINNPLGRYRLACHRLCRYKPRLPSGLAWSGSSRCLFAQTRRENLIDGMLGLEQGVEGNIQTRSRPHFISCPPFVVIMRLLCTCFLFFYASVPSVGYPNSFCCCASR